MNQKGNDIGRNYEPASAASQQINRISDAQWEAIFSNDSSHDGHFYYAVRTTGIYCRPSCKSRPPRRDNAEVFPTSADAESAGYRPCKRCKPSGERLPDEDWAEQITALLDRQYMDNLNLATLSDMCHGSPYHLHRTFKKIKGMTPLAYLQQTRIREAEMLLLATDLPMTKIGEMVGLPNTPYFATLFKTITGLTPASYRKLDKQEVDNDEHKS